MQYNRSKSTCIADIADFWNISKWHDRKDEVKICERWVGKCELNMLLVHTKIWYTVYNMVDDMKDDNNYLIDDMEGDMKMALLSKKHFSQCNRFDEMNFY